MGDFHLQNFHLKIVFIPGILGMKRGISHVIIQMDRVKISTEVYLIGFIHKKIHYIKYVSCRKICIENSILIFIFIYVLLLNTKKITYTVYSANDHETGR